MSGSGSLAFIPLLQLQYKLQQGGSAFYPAIRYLCYWHAFSIFFSLSDLFCFGHLRLEYRNRMLESYYFYGTTVIPIEAVQLRF